MATMKYEKPLLVDLNSPNIASGLCNPGSGDSGGCVPGAGPTLRCRSGITQAGIAGQVTLRVGDVGPAARQEVDAQLAASEIKSSHNIRQRS